MHECTMILFLHWNDEPGWSEDMTGICLRTDLQLEFLALRNNQVYSLCGTHLSSINCSRHPFASEHRNTNYLLALYAVHPCVAADCDL